MQTDIPPAPAPPSRRRLWGLRALALAAAVAAGAQAVQVRHAGAVEATRAADALPLYLSAAVVRDGGDPTDPAALRAAHAARGMQVEVPLFSTLYPASAGVLLQPLAVRPWATFVPPWRDLLLGGVLLAGAAAGLAAARGPAAPLAAGLGAWIAVGTFPFVGEGLRLGQVNLAVAGAFAVAMAAASRGWMGAAGAAATLGAAVKLVPAAALWPLLAGRHVRGLVVAGVVGAAALALTFAYVPPARAIAGVLATLEFQAGVTPDWLARPGAPAWVRVLGALRHTPLAAWTVALAGVVGWLGRSPAAAAGGIALAAAWLGADAAGFHVLYAPLYLPALVYAALWPLDARAPRFAWLLVPVAASPWLLAAWSAPGIPVEARLVLAGLIAWAAVAVRLVAEAPPLPRAARLALLVVGLGGALAAARILLPPPPPPPGSPPPLPAGAPQPPRRPD